MFAVMLRETNGTIRTEYNPLRYVFNKHVITCSTWNTREEADAAADKIRAAQSRCTLNVWVEER